MELDALELELVAVSCQVDPTDLRTQKQDTGTSPLASLYRPFVVTVLRGHADVFIGKVENTDVMHYTKRGLHSIIKVLLGGDKSQRPPALGRQAQGER